MKITDEMVYKLHGVLQGKLGVKFTHETARAALEAALTAAPEAVGWIDQQGLNKLRHGWSSTIYPERIESDDLIIPLHTGVTIDT
jgi:predicted ThiF/HesA family dinucleotide-utilizing enzyme